MKPAVRRSWLLAALWAALILAGGSIPGPALPRAPSGADMLAHLCLYTVLGALLANALGREHPGGGILLLVLISTGMAAGLGLLDEWHQQFCQRAPSALDWLADTIGAGIGSTSLAVASARKLGGVGMAEAPKVNGEQLAAELSKPGPCVVEFWMVGCGACARFAPTFGDLSEEYAGRANLVAIEARENMDASKQHGIRGVPTVIVFKDGAEVQRTTGAKTLAEMREWLDPVLD